MSGSPGITFLIARSQNLFFRELAEALCDELGDLGAPASIAEAPGSDDDPDRVYALLPPHEYVKLARRPLPRRILGRTIFICAEQPESYWFEVNARLAPMAGAFFDINPTAVGSFRERGVVAEHLPLGYTRRWDRFGSAEREIDVSFLGTLTPRRERLLAEYAPELAARRCNLVLAGDRGPNHSPTSSFIADDEKRELLARSKVLLNLHRDENTYFEWLRIIEAIHCGAVVVTEPSSDHSPLVEGEHFVAGRADGLARVAGLLAEDEGRRREISTAAYEMLRETQPLSAAAKRLAETAENLTARPARTPSFPALRTAAAVLQPDRIRERIEQRQRFRPSLPRTAPLRRELKDARLEGIELSRRVAWLEETIRRGEEPPALEVVYETSARADAPEAAVSVVTALYNHSQHVADALDSVAEGSFRDLELIVVDDGSTDGSGEVVREWLVEHDELPAVLARHPANRGLPTTRNTALGMARGRYVLILDADNELYPNCVERLFEALERDPGSRLRVRDPGEVRRARRSGPARGPRLGARAAGGDELHRRPGADPPLAAR